MTNDDLDPCLLAPLPLGVMSEEIERLRTALAERDATIERLTKERFAALETPCRAALSPDTQEAEHGRE